MPRRHGVGAHLAAGGGAPECRHRAAPQAHLRHREKKQVVERDVGYAILGAKGYEIADEIVFAQPGDMLLLGVRTVEGFGVMVDSICHRFVTQATRTVSVHLC